MTIPSRLRRAAQCAALAFALAPATLSQASSAPPTAVTNVRLLSSPADADDAALGEGEASEERFTVLLRDGRIAAVQPAEQAVPAGHWVLDAEGALALPSFLDAYTRKGVETPEPVKDQDRPVDEASDVRIDMRLANRKGVQPTFRAADTLTLEEEDLDAWNESGFGAALVAPSGELLSGDGALIALRDAARRDLVLRPQVFAHGAFQASGPSYPSTLMGYTAQLRQFFLDAEHQAALRRRFSEGRPGPRPAFDDELEAGLGLLRGERRLAVHADGWHAIERWLRLGDRFGLSLALTGGGQAWRVAERLAEQSIPVVLTLQWSDEVDDPFADDGDGDGDAKGEDAEDEEAAASKASSATEEGASEADTVWDYTEPLGVRAERRRLWEEERDNALRLAEAGVPLAFGTAGGSPKKLLEHVRTLIELGLPREAAQRALCDGAAELLGVEGRLGRLAAGFDATLTLWTADPLTDEKARVRWIFVDGHRRTFDVDGGLEGTPAEGVDLTGTWTLVYARDGEDVEATLELEMAEDGAVSGTFTTPNPFGEGDWTAPVSGQVADTEVQLELELEVQTFTIPVEVKGEVDPEGSDSMEGKLIARPSWSEQSDVQSFRATKNDPEGGAL